MWGNVSKHAYRKHITVKTSKWQVKRRVEEQKTVKEIFLKVMLMVTIISNVLSNISKDTFCLNSRHTVIQSSFSFVHKLRLISFVKILLSNVQYVAPFY